MNRTFLSKLAIVVAVMGWLASPASAQTVRYFSSTTAPASVTAGSDNTHSITIENCNNTGACVWLHYQRQPNHQIRHGGGSGRLHRDISAERQRDGGQGVDCFIERKHH